VIGNLASSQQQTNNRVNNALDGVGALANNVPAAIRNPVSAAIGNTQTMSTAHPSQLPIPTRGRPNGGTRKT